MIYLKTPLIKSFPISNRLDKSVFLKLENLQPTASFKIRGVERVCIRARENGINHFVSSSAGNAGYSVAYVAHELGAQATIFVPNGTSKRIISILNSVNAQVEVGGDSWNDAHGAAIAFNEEVNGQYIHPFDNELLWEGHATMIDEVALEIDKPDAVVLSVGGGGMLSGVAKGLESNKWGDVPIVAVETEGADSLNQSMKQNELIELGAITSIAKSLGAKQVCTNAFEISKRKAFNSVVVSDEAAKNACYQFSMDHRFIVEPACGASLSLVYNNHPALTDKQNILVIVCGGLLSDAEDIAKWQE